MKFFIVWNNVLPSLNKYDSLMAALVAKSKLKRVNPNKTFTIMESINYD